MRTCPKCGEEIEDQFESCWNCAGEPDQTGSSTQKLSFLFFVFAVVMAFLAPVFADCLHSVMVVTGSYRLYNAELGRIATPFFWIFAATRGIITFLIVWFFARIRFRDIWVWCCLVGLWTFLDMQMEIAMR
jgi:hypothetical protein